MTAVNTTSSSNMVTDLFADRESAERAYDEVSACVAMPRTM